MSKLMDAIEGINDEYIKEFAFVETPKRVVPIWVKLGSMAAGLVLITLTITLIAGKNNSTVPVVGSDSSSEYDLSEPFYSQTDNSLSGSEHNPSVSSYSPIGSSGNVSEHNPSTTSYPQTVSSGSRSDNNSSEGSDVPTEALPLVYFNDTCYVVAAYDCFTYDLPEGYVLVGEVTTTDRADKDKNGYSSGCHVGDKIYQNPANPHDVLVNTELFHFGIGYWYIRFAEHGYNRTPHTSAENETASDVLPETKSDVESTVTVDKNAMVSEVKAAGSRWNVPSEGDEIRKDYFVHTYSNGEQACVPFDSETERHYFNIPTLPIDVEALKKLGSDTPLTDEICYEVVEFLDGTKRYFKLGEAPLAFTDPLRYGIYTYIEGGSGEFYSEVLPDGMTIEGWR